MIGLVIAANESLANAVEESLQERTAGIWRSRVFVHRLSIVPEYKERNNADIEQLAATYPTALIMASSNLCSARIEKGVSNVRRYTRDKLMSHVLDWINAAGLSWRKNAELCRQRGSFQWGTVHEWCHQFHRVDPERGSRVAAAILAQLKVVSAAEMAQWFDHLSEVDQNVYFIGADPHSGDHSLVNVLAARIDGCKLHEASRIPADLKDDATLRLFGDAAWSGGESARRLECLYTACSKKSASLKTTHELHMRFAYITDAAEKTIEKKIDDLATDGRCTIRSVKISTPVENRLEINTTGKMKGLAFQRQELLAYVDADDPTAMRSLCKKIGEQIFKKRPLGTDDLASTIAFEHSIPRAMLPVLIYGGASVKASDGTNFAWKALLSSAHVTKPAHANNDVHCERCPMVAKKQEVKMETVSSAPAGIQAESTT